MLPEPLIEKSMVVRKLKTSWIEAGERGRPVLFFCHGFPDSSIVWEHQIRTLEKHYHIVAPFVRGCENSEPGNDVTRYGRDAIVLDHLAILKAVTTGDEPVICIGHDLGVVHAMTLVRRLGDRACGLVVINGLDLEMFTRRLRDPKQVVRSWYMGFMQVPVLPEILANFAPHTGAWLAKSLAGGDVAAGDMVGFDRRSAAPLNQYRALAREAATIDEHQARIRPHVLAIWGRDDGVLVPPTQKEWDLAALKVTIRIIPGGHWLHRDKSEIVTGFISDFCHQRLTEAKQGKEHA